MATHLMEFPPAYPALRLYPLNGMFTPKQLVLGGGVRVAIGRKTDATTIPTERNGFFDAKAVSRQHAEVWEADGKIFIKDVKSSNGTYINGERLSAESVESDPHELKSDDIVEFGVDIIAEGNQLMTYQKVAARVLVILTPKDALAAALEHSPDFGLADKVTPRRAPEPEVEATAEPEAEPLFDRPMFVPPYRLIDGAPHGLPALPIRSANIGSSATTSTVAIIGMQTPTEDVVSSLVIHGCKDLTRTIDFSTFGDYPISEGGFGDIYRGRMLDGTQVAIKTLRIFVGAANQNPKALKHAAKELHTWSKCKHPNVLELLGLAVFRDRIGMVAPWVDHGNISSYLERVLDINRCRLCAQICDGLSYLHEIGIIHGDLKGTNVLISGDGRALLTDFGNSLLAERSLQFTHTTEKSSMTMRWSAPELITGSDTYSKAADVYALGMTLLETITGMPPYHGKPERSIMYTVVVKRELPGRPEEHIPTNSEDGNKLWDLLVSCWSFEPEERPSASLAAQTMGTITQEGMTPS